MRIATTFINRANISTILRSLAAAPPVGRLGGGGGGGGRGGGTEVPADRQQRQRPTTDCDHFL